MCNPAGFFFGRTPLIKLSPKKTWEGFIGGALLTLVASWYLARYMSRFPWMICERNVSGTLNSVAYVHHLIYQQFSASTWLAV